MPQLTYTQQNMPPSGKVLREQLNSALENNSELDDFVLLIQELTRLEIQHGMASSEFWQRFQSGELGDNIEWIRWANKYEIYQEMHGNITHLFETLTHYTLPAVP